MAFARQINLQDYAGFNLIIGDAEQAVIVNNRGHAPTALHSGLHIFSNGQPDEGWFKTEKLRGRLRQEVLPLIGEDSGLDYWQDAAFTVMSDKTLAPADELPETGVAKPIEQALSSVFIAPIVLNDTAIKMPSYGTRTQSILTLRYERGESPKARVTLVSRETDDVLHEN